MRLALDGQAIDDFAALPQEAEQARPQP